MNISERALDLLAQGISAEQVASALGVTPSAISQLLSQEEFAAALAEKRFEVLRKNNARDSELDSLEDTLIEQLKGSLPMVFDPIKQAKILQVVNAAKRRGAATPETGLTPTKIISLTIPITLVNRFSVNGLNQVISTGAQDLVTIQSSSMKALLNESANTLSPGAGIVEELPVYSSPSATSEQVSSAR